MNFENFILINLNQNISRARKVAQKEQRDKWIIFGLLCFILVGLTGWFFQINKKFDRLIQARESTIQNIKTKTTNLKKDAKINLSRGDIISSYDLGKRDIPWSRKLIQLAEMTPYNMCITKLVYDTKSLSISAISKVENDGQKEQQILNDFMNLIKSNEDFYREFDEIKIKKTRKIDKDSQSYLSFEISAQLKKKLQNRMDNLIIGNNTKIIKKEKKKKVQNKEKKKKKAKYSNEIIELAKAINIEDNDIYMHPTKTVKDFHEKLDIHSIKDPSYGIFDSKTILIYGDVLGIEPETPWEKEKRRIDKVLAGIEDPKEQKNQKSGSKQKRNSNTNGYDKLTIKIANAMAAQIGAGVPKPDLDLIKRFQELTGIATENDSWYGVFNNETIEMLGKVMRAQK